MKLLLVDDDTDLLDVLAYALRREGFDVVVANDGVHALQRMEEDRPDLIISDVVMPRLDGFELCWKVRQTSTIPVILLTALNSEEQIVRGLQLGADDYITKPFSPRQLALRVRAVLRRGTVVSEPEPKRELRVEGLVLDVESYEVWHRDRPIQMTPIEFRLLHILCINHGRVVNSSRLVDFAWDYNGGDISLLKTHISHIRGNSNCLNLISVQSAPCHALATAWRVFDRCVQEQHESTSKNACACAIRSLPPILRRIAARASA